MNSGDCGSLEITHNLDNYSDLAHHSPAVGEQVLGFLDRGEHRVAADNPTASLEQLHQQVQAFPN